MLSTRILRSDNVRRTQRKLNLYIWMTTPRKKNSFEFFSPFPLLKIEQFEAKWKTGENSNLPRNYMRKILSHFPLFFPLSLSCFISRSLPLSKFFTCFDAAAYTRVSRYDDMLLLWPHDDDDDDAVWRKLAQNKHNSLRFTRFSLICPKSSSLLIV